MELTKWGEKHGKSRENGGFRGRNEGFRGLWRLFRLRNEAFFLGVKAEEVRGCVREAGHEQRRLHRLGGAPEVLRGSVHQDQGPEHVRNACDAVFGRGKQVMFIDFHRFSSFFIDVHRCSSICNAFWRRNDHFRPLFGPMLGATGRGDAAAGGCAAPLDAAAAANSSSGATRSSCATDRRGPVERLRAGHHRTLQAGGTGKEIGNKPWRARIIS